MQLCILCNHLKSNDGPVIPSHMIHCLPHPIGDQPSSVSANKVYCQKSMSCSIHDVLVFSCVREKSLCSANHRPRQDSMMKTYNVLSFGKWPNNGHTPQQHLTSIVQISWGSVSMFGISSRQSKRQRETRTRRAMEKAGADLEGNSIHSPGHAL